MFNTRLIDVASGERAYEITTVSVPSTPQKSKSSSEPLSSSKTAAPSEEHFPVKQDSFLSVLEKQDVQYRQTEIKNALGRVVAHVQWEGRYPYITIDDKEVGGLNDLFGSSSVRFM
jgi:RNA-binding protein PNO1